MDPTKLPRLTAVVGLVRGEIAFLCCGFGAKEAGFCSGRVEQEGVSVNTITVTDNSPTNSYRNT